MPTRATAKRRRDGAASGRWMDGASSAKCDGLARLDALDLGVADPQRLPGELAGELRGGRPGGGRRDGNADLGGERVDRVARAELGALDGAVGQDQRQRRGD